jgi:hypothetical protein
MRARNLFLAAALSLTGCHFGPRAIVGDDVPFDWPSAGATAVIARANCPGLRWHEASVGNCAPPDKNQIELTATATAGEVAVVLYPDSKGQYPELVTVEYQATLEHAPITDSQVFTFPMGWETPVVSGDHETAVAKPPAGTFASFNQQDPSYLPSTLNALAIKSPGCLSSLRVQLEDGPCDTNESMPADFDPPTFWIKNIPGS